MDSITQIALGASVATAVMGRKAGFRAPLWGAALGTLPDLDVLIPMGGAVADFTYHRSFSHSLLVLAALSPALSWLIRRCHPSLAHHRRSWLWMVLLVLLTHPLLDAFTIYGTQLLWPLDPTPVGLGSIFIIDPLYTLPLLLGCGLFLALRNNQRGLRANAVGLVLSSLYLLWSAVVQQHVEQRAHQQLGNSLQPHSRVLVQPAPFTTLLWRVLIVDANRYSIGFYALSDGDQPIQLRHYANHESLLRTLDNHWPVERLRWFTKGFYSVRSSAEGVIMQDLRMGLEPDYVFQFKVAHWQDEQLIPITDERIPSQRSLHRLAPMWARIWRRPADDQAPGF
ncbi:metal-dependent hydrolase [Motiliproteus sediminis]|uniref:metal-dependent hydrolase n=1 Tax=Motiliproteus sediminis TaxID=1468178 RepID=UPI001AEFF394|nr:metal-dependent hydrolase [Motiliproteus sediminis]